MTYILGAKCRDGVVMVGDRKVSSSDGSVMEWGSKIYPVPIVGEHPSRPILWGSAGQTRLYLSFNDRVRTELDRFFRTAQQINLAEFNIIVENVFEEMGRLSEEYTNLLRLGNLQVLIAHRFGRWSGLHLVNELGAPEPISKLKVIGSGEPYGAIFFTSVDPNECTMEDVAKKAYLAIKYIEKFGLDKKVGVGMLKPQMWFYPDNPPKGKSPSDGPFDIHEATENAEQMVRVESFVDAKLAEIERTIQELDKGS